MTNPLLQEQSLPAFSRIRPEHIEPAVDQLLATNRKRIATLLESNTSYTWLNLLQPLEECQDRLNRLWSPIRHLHSVSDNEALRAAYNTCLAKLTEYETELQQNRDLHLAYRQIAEGDEYERLDQPQKKIIDNALRDFRLSGIDLPAAGQKQYSEIVQGLTRLQTRFEENLLDATQSWTKNILVKGQLDGLPESALDLAAETARQDNKSGWIFTLQIPSYLPVMQYADNRELRREMYHAYVTRASDQGPHSGQHDNGPTMLEILALRREMAGLLGYDNFAEYSLERKMADTPEQVLAFLTDLADRSRSVAGQELQQLEQFARAQFNIDKLHAWDIAYYTEKYKQHRFDFTQEDLRPYFPVAKVIEGLFSIVNRLYGISISKQEGVEVWYPDVEFFQIHAADGVLRGGFYLDLYARQHKRGGAWMDECVIRKNFEGDIQTPVAYLTCNFTPPVGNEPALLTHDEVQTLFHEFGHGLHHMLTLVDYPSVSGINGVPWDAVELPSQFLENWCWERAALDILGANYQTGAAIPEELFDNMLRARKFQAGMQMVRQLEFALFDFHLHYDNHAASIEDIQILLDNVRQRVAVVKPPAYNRFQHGFAHIFAGGYAAGYYSYKWAEVLSADAFSSFEENGIFDEPTGRHFLHTILEQGGARDPMELFVDFRGRRPDIQALLRHSGILDQESRDTA